MRILLAMTCLLATFTSLAENIGLSAHEIQTRSNYLSAELINKVSIDEGLGIQVRATHFSAKKFTTDAGYAFHSGDREHRLFLGGAYELFPDYRTQPRITLKAQLELVGLVRDFDFLAGLTPMASKGISFDGYILYPFLGLPIKKLFRKNAETEMGVAMGTTMELAKNLIFNFETTFNLKNMPTSFLIGISTNL